MIVHGWAMEVLQTYLLIGTTGLKYICAYATSFNLQETLCIFLITYSDDILHTMTSNEINTIKVQWLKAHVIANKCGIYVTMPYMYYLFLMTFGLSPTHIWCIVMALGETNYMIFDKVV